MFLNYCNTVEVFLQKTQQIILSKDNSDLEAVLQIIKQISSLCISSSLENTNFHSQSDNGMKLSAESLACQVFTDFKPIFLRQLLFTFHNLSIESGWTILF